MEYLVVVALVILLLADFLVQANVGGLSSGHVITNKDGKRLGKKAVNKRILQGDEEVGKKTADTESTDKEAADTESTDKEAADTESTDKEAADTESTDKEAADTENTNEETTTTETTNIVTTKTETRRTRRGPSRPSLMLELYDDADEEKYKVPISLGDYACAQGCSRFIENIFQLPICLIAGRLPHHGIRMLHDCSVNNKERKCKESLANCLWIIAPDDFDTALGDGFCVPKQLVGDEDVMLFHLNKFGKYFNNLPLPTYPHLMECLSMSGDSECAEKRDGSGKSCAVCDGIPEKNYPMDPPISELCVQNDAIEPCNKFRQEDLAYCPVRRIPILPRNIPILTRVACLIGCTRKVETLSQLAVCSLGAKLQGNGLSHLVDCSRYATQDLCEGTANTPQCRWLQLPASIRTKLDPAICLPSELLVNVNAVYEGFQYWEDVVPNLPSYAEIITCLEQTAATCETTTVNDRDCFLCEGIPATATSPMNPPLTQLCLHDAIADLVCDDLKAISLLEECPRRSDSVSHSGVAFISLLASLLIVLVS